jgi:hypothetical protein
MADDRAVLHIDDDDDCATDDSGSGEEYSAGKRPRLGTVRGRPGVVPADFIDAIIKLRIAKEKTFLQSCDGRSKNTSRRLWEDIGKELKTAFGDRADISESAYGARQLGKRWSYIEAQFKVSVCCAHS